MDGGSFELRLEQLRQRAAEREPGLTQKVLKGLLRPLLSAWLTSVDGLDMLPGEGRVSFPSNHRSHLDHFLLAYRIRRQVQFMAAAELFSDPVAGSNPAGRTSGDPGLHGDALLGASNAAPISRGNAIHRSGPMRIKYPRMAR